MKQPQNKSKNKLKDTGPKNIDIEIDTETKNKNVNTEIRKIKSSSPIEVTQIDENSSLEKPKKKGWWTQ